MRTRAFAGLVVGALAFTALAAVVTLILGEFDETAAGIILRCPRCGTQRRAPAGRSWCPACGQGVAVTPIEDGPPAPRPGSGQVLRGLARLPVRALS